jgi:HCOMODA/2-hydroxy-3-carboxy-muconic semialdehyde decarboxylase
MRGHGSVTAGPNVRHAVGRAYYLEVNAKLQAQAIALGGTITYLDPEEARKVEARRDYERPWELWKRKALGK